ncbi:MAG TPA: GNAT family N-acetyltransferase [Asanoa sp.]
MDAHVTDNAARKRFEIAVDGEPAGFAAYRLRDGVVVFTHTRIDPAFEGRGVGGTLARAALDQVRERGDGVVAQCPFIAGWIEKHPDYQDLLVPA